MGGLHIVHYWDSIKALVSNQAHIELLVIDGMVQHYGHLAEAERSKPSTRAENNLMNQARKLETNMAPETHNIQNLFRTVYPFRISMMGHLTATDLATLCYALELSLTQQERDMYLLLIRDLPNQRQWIESRVENGARVTIVSKDLPSWLMRVKNPYQYWDTRTTHIVMRIWIIGPFSVEEQREDRSRKDDMIMLMDDELYEVLIKHANPSQDDIDLWNTSSTMNWPAMPVRYHNVMQAMHTIESEEMTWIIPPGCWERLIDYEGGYWVNQRIHDEVQLRDRNQNKECYVCLKSPSSPIEIMYTPQVDKWYIDMDWMPSGLIDYSGTRIRTYSLSFPNDEEIFAHAEQAVRHLNQLLGGNNMHIMIKGKCQSPPGSTSRQELAIVI
ncbi:hypothetical protein LTR56_027511 [Elasticomyces elasticus]|nr:hypothetical protein LTR22_028015 [Elasticomyces elasticus]KAK3614052.1 hypothetical protein LTR56_027511 [Elasticomyces elasticus]KAK4899309.1 hypothetical protein LTR49_027681 [Elasticomyces elasticus]